MSNQRGIPEFGDLMLACRHHLILTLLSATSMVLLLACFAWCLIDPRYQAEGLIRVREQQDVIFAPQTTRADDSAFFRSQAKLVASPQVMTEAVRVIRGGAFASYLPDRDPVGWLGRSLQVHTQSGSEVMSIRVDHPSPAVAQAFCNAVTQAYLVEITQRIASDRHERERQLREAAMKADQQLDLLWDHLNRVAQSVGSDSAASMTIRDEMQHQAYRDYSRQLQAAQLMSNQLQSQLAAEERMQATRPAPPKRVPEVVDDAMVLRQPEVIAAKKQVLRLDLQISQIQKIAANSDSPKVQQLVDQRHFYQSQLDQLIQRTREQLRRRIPRAVAETPDDPIAKIQQQIERNRSEKDFLRERLSEIDSIVSRPAEKTTVPLDMSRHAIERQRRLADNLWQSLQELQIEAQSQPRVTLIELAKLPEIANHSRQLKAAAAAGLGGFVVVVFAIGYVEWRGCRIRTPQDVTARWSHPVFGAASFSVSRSNKSTSSGTREAAVSLIRRADSGNGESIRLMVTSCIANEPRHLVAMELASVLGTYGRKVLLIDADADQCLLGEALAIDHMPGIFQLMSAGDVSDARLIKTLDQMIVTTNQPGLDVLPRGSKASPSAWMDPRLVRRIFQALKTSFDTIVINGPSLTESDESLLLASEADCSLFAVFLHQSRWSQLVACEQTAARVEMTVAGCVLHDGQTVSDLKITVGENAETNLGVSSQDDQENQLCTQVSKMHQEIREAQVDSSSVQNSKHEVGS